MRMYTQSMYTSAVASGRVFDPVSRALRIYQQLAVRAKSGEEGGHANDASPDSSPLDSAADGSLVKSIDILDSKKQFERDSRAHRFLLVLNIDSIMSSKPTRQVPMKVLALGYSRTGTKSLRDALLTLGYDHTYHTFDAVFLNPQDCKTWLDALNAKCDGVGKKFGREEFDQLLGHCQAVTDMPAAFFAPELIEAYPEAKVILTTRDIDEWHSSVKSTIEAANTNPLSTLLGLTSTLLLMPNRWNRPLFKKLDQVLYANDFDANGRTSYLQHYQLVRSLVPPERLLEYHVSDGWEPLCSFLGVPVPEGEDVPFVNRKDEFREAVRGENVENLKAQGRRVLEVVALGGVVVSLVAVLMGRLGARK
ncbi:hypothetical protein FQN54_002672 [Arachnomyces sp. PD_36]|nr:hypothetical protein FQN54_002672 [Arachnomyces sp. PD_36]